MPNVTIFANIAKVNEEERMVYGFASVAKDGDTVLVDKQGDQINEVELVKMAHSFIKGARHGKVMHEGSPMAEVVESIVLRPEVASALGLENFTKTAWVIGMKVHDDKTWSRVKKGELKAFSIGGKGKRTEVKKDGRAGRDADGDGETNESGKSKKKGPGIGSMALTGASAIGGGILGAKMAPRYGGAGSKIGYTLGGVGAGLAARGGLHLLNEGFSDWRTGFATGSALGGLGGAIAGGKALGPGGAVLGLSLIHI